MNQKDFIIILLFTLLLSCTGKNEKETENAQTDYFYCYINKIYEKNSTQFVRVDKIQVLTGDSAVLIAKQIGQAEFEISNSGDTTWFVPNDYFVLNETQEDEEFPIAKNCNIEITVSDESTSYQLTEQKNVSVEKLKSHLYDYMIFLVEVKDGFITSIKEYWTP
jgi:hypothetical protein